MNYFKGVELLIQRRVRDINYCLKLLITLNCILRKFENHTAIMLPYFLRIVLRFLSSLPASYFILSRNYAKSGTDGFPWIGQFFLSKVR